MLLALVTASDALAVCTLARGRPTILTISGKLMTISADAPASTSVPFAEFNSPLLGQAVGYDHCLAGSEYGKRVINLTGQDSATRIYQTDIPGIGIKLLYSNGSAFGNFPSTSYLRISSGDNEATFDYPPQSYFRIQFFKTRDRLNLSQPLTGDRVLSAGDIAYNYVLSANPSNYAMKLSIGEMRIISTPACTADGAKTVNFNDVTPSLLKNGVERDLDFAITCQSDYGSYSASASITTRTPSADASYIQVLDANGSKERLGIRITDGGGKAMKINGTTTEQKSSVTSYGSAQFHWKATLIPIGQAAPAGGAFSASAEIVFTIQ
ncbi:fimbrial protein [Escherichia alba]|uniref:Fimbrial protein n=2 Tax=Intestinirhabdus alba TaxID=2899544 RepID=A0A6L6IPI8_9ENTR|nr:fimbrial protein [Intestinirhabdus alba]